MTTNQDSTSTHEEAPLGCPDAAELPLYCLAHDDRWLRASRALERRAAALAQALAAAGSVVGSPELQDLAAHWRPTAPMICRAFLAAQAARDTVLRMGAGYERHEIDAVDAADSAVARVYSDLQDLAGCAHLSHHEAGHHVEMLEMLGTEVAS